MTPSRSTTGKKNRVIADDTPRGEGTKRQWVTLPAYRNRNKRKGISLNHHIEIETKEKVSPASFSLASNTCSSLQLTTMDVMSAASKRAIAVCRELSSATLMR